MMSFLEIKILFHLDQPRVIKASCFLTWDLLVEGATWQLNFSVCVPSVPLSSSPSSSSLPCGRRATFLFDLLRGSRAGFGLIRSPPFFARLPRPSPAVAKSRSGRAVLLIGFTFGFFSLLLLQGFNAEKHANVHLLQTGGLGGLALERHGCRHWRRRYLWWT